MFIDHSCCQVEELKTVPNEPGLSAPALAAKSLDQELNANTGGSTVKTEPLPVNDLTSVVKKKKKPAPDATQEKEDTGSNGATSTKRKAEEDDSNSVSDKKAKLEDTPQAPAS